MRGKSKDKSMYLDNVDEALQKEILKLRKPPHEYSLKRLEAWLLENHGIQLSHVSIGKWIDRREATVRAAVYGSEKFKIDTLNAYADILTNFFNGTKEVSQLLSRIVSEKSMDRVAQSEMACKLYTQIRDGTLTAQQIIVGTTGADKALIDVEKELDKLSEKGDIQLRIVKEVEGSSNLEPSA